MRQLHYSLRSSLPCALVALVAILFAGSPARAQRTSTPVPTVAIGLTGALTHNTHRGNGATGFESDCWEDAPGGRALGYAAGVAVDIPIDERFTIDAHLAYETRPGMVINRKTDARRVTILEDGDSMRVLVNEDSVMYRNDLVCELVTLDAMLEGRILEASKSVSIRGIAGFGLASIIRGTATRAREIPAVIEGGSLPASEGEVVENNGRRVVYERDREVDGLRDLRLSIKGGLALAFDLSSALYMRSGVYYDFGVTALSASPEWRLSSTLVQIDFLVRL
jgi:hypothetical protein